MSTKTVAGVVHSNPAESPVNPLAGQAVVAAIKNPGQPNGNVAGQVAGTSVIVKNPG
jgi:hypothetical protein